MDGSEEESGCERSSTSRGFNTPACPVASGSLELPHIPNPAGGSSREASNRKVRDAPEVKEAEPNISCFDKFERRRGGFSIDQRSGGGNQPQHRRGGDAAGKGCAIVEEEVSLREWLDRPERSVDLLECLHIFRQVVEMVSLAHSQGVVVNNVRPSCFVMSTFNRVSFIESASCSSSGSDSCGNAQAQGSERKDAGDRCSASLSQPTETAPDGTLEQASETSCLRSCSVHITHASSIQGPDGRKDQDNGREGREASERKRSFPLKQILLMEYNWYTSPEEAAGSTSSFSSDIYRLGVLLFELFCAYSSPDEKLRTMSNLRHRVLPSPLLLKWPKEASFCLWLLHPLPNTRPKLSEVLQSEFLSEPRDSFEEREAAIKLREEIEDQELLLEFLLQLQQHKQETADKLHDMIRYLSSDVEEVLKQLAILKKKGNFYSELEKEEHSPAMDRQEQPLTCPERIEDSISSGSRKRVRQKIRAYNEHETIETSSEGQRSESQQKNQGVIFSKSYRVMKNFKKLEAAYFSTRCRMIKPANRLVNRNLATGSLGRGSMAKTEGSSVDNLPYKDVQAGGFGESINPFHEGLCKYLNFSKLTVRADLKQGDLLNSSSLVCSLGFDRDKELFATAGVNRKIKIFECDVVLNEERDIHYPVVEMTSRSKLSSVCWNSYIKSQIASSDFEGIVQVWDVSRSQVYVEMREHERRVWSVDFSLADPTKLASGSDDCTVKLWNINQSGSIGTIRTKANVCSVQFSPDSGRSLAIGSADHRIYLYDLRNLRVPWCTLGGHTKTVSYVKFVDSSTLASASTDNTLKLWDLSMSNSRVLDTPLQTFTGHTNVKNFVGLSISDGYIATGSETNEIFVYHKAFPMPVLSFKFNSNDPLSGREVDDGTQFISCVCWRGQSSILVAANSTGNIKLLEMV